MAGSVADSVTAYVLIVVPAKHSGGVREELIKMGTGVTEVDIILGDCDIMAKVSVGSLAALHTLVMKDIQGIAAVKSTRTFIVVPPEEDIDPKPAV